MQRWKSIEGGLLPALLGLALVLAGCSKDGASSEKGGAAAGTIEGRVIPIIDSLEIAGVAPDSLVQTAKEAFVPTKATAHALSAIPSWGGSTPSDPPFAVPLEEEFVPGEAVVKLRGGFDEAFSRLEEEASLGGYRFEVGDWATEKILSLRFRSVKAPEIVPSPAETMEVAERLGASGIFDYAHLNHYRYALSAPNDELYEFTWHYHLLDMESAWTLTTGSPDVTIAVIDSGVQQHVDLSRLLPGYDFVSSPQLAGDGDGRDPDPSPVPGRGSAYHGQHVAGTIGADANNEIGIPGMDWQAQILPIRTMGVRGYGTSVDLIASLVWSVGWEVPGVPPNPHPAQVINLSLGGRQLVEAEQEAVDMARARGAIIVVAAGNDNRDARNFSLSGYRGVITVGATDFLGQRAPYSNFGPAVTVMAPGGNLAADVDGDGHRDGVLSLWYDRQNEEDSYRYLQGTSMAAPHVTGLVGLMKALEPSLTHDDAAQILRETARAEYQCREGCGAGLIDPARALEAAAALGERAARLHLPIERLDLGPRSQIAFPIENIGSSALAWYADFRGEDADRFRLNRSGGSVPPMLGAELKIQVDRSRLADGQYRATLEIVTTGGSAEVPISFSVGRVEFQDLGTARVLAFNKGPDGELIVGGEAEVDASLGYAFEFSVAPGKWYLAAMVDLDGDGMVGESDLLGFWPNNAEPLQFEIGPDEHLDDFELILEPAGL